MCVVVNMAEGESPFLTQPCVSIISAVFCWLKQSQTYSDSRGWENRLHLLMEGVSEIWGLCFKTYTDIYYIFQCFASPVIFLVKFLDLDNRGKNAHLSAFTQILSNYPL